MNPSRLRHMPRVERRRWLLGVGAFLGFAASLPRTTRTASAGISSTATRTSLRQQVEYAVSPDRIYAALTESDQFATFTGMPAQIEPRPGGAFSLFKGLVAGWNLELLPGQRIVQAWRPIEDFEPGVYSIVRFDLQPISTGTRVTLNHTGFPEGHYEHLNAGWPIRYWKPLRQFVESSDAGHTY